MFTDLLGAFRLFKNLLTYRQLLYINVLLLLGFQLWVLACCCSPFLIFPKQPCSAAKSPNASVYRESIGLAFLPLLVSYCCLLTNIQLLGNVESALLLFHLIFFTPCTGFFSSAAPAVLSFPWMVESAPAAICASYKDPSCLLDLSCPDYICHFPSLANQL